MRNTNTTIYFGKRWYFCAPFLRSLAVGALLFVVFAVPQSASAHELASHSGDEPLSYSIVARPPAQMYTGRVYALGDLQVLNKEWEALNPGLESDPGSHTLETDCVLKDGAGLTLYSTGYVSGNCLLSAEFPEPLAPDTYTLSVNARMDFAHTDGGVSQPPIPFIDSDSTTWEVLAPPFDAEAVCAFGVFGDDFTTFGNRSLVEAFSSGNGENLVVTNGTQDGAITLNDDSRVLGDVTIGAGGNPVVAPIGTPGASVWKHDDATISGSVVTLPSSLSFSNPIAPGSPSRAEPDTGIIAGSAVVLTEDEIRTIDVCDDPPSSIVLDDRAALTLEGDCALDLDNLELDRFSTLMITGDVRQIRVNAFDFNRATFAADHSISFFANTATIPELQFRNLPNIAVAGDFLIFAGGTVHIGNQSDVAVEGNMLVSTPGLFEVKPEAVNFTIRDNLSVIVGALSIENANHVDVEGRLYLVSESTFVVKQGSTFTSDEEAHVLADSVVLDNQTEIIGSDEVVVHTNAFSIDNNGKGVSQRTGIPKTSHILVSGAGIIDIGRDIGPIRSIIYGPGAPLDISPRTSIVGSIVAKNVTSGSDLDVIGDFCNVEPPVAVAIPDGLVLETKTYTLDGTGSSDPDGSVAAYAWAQTKGTAATIDSADQAIASFTAPNVSENETLEFELVVTDNDEFTSDPGVDPDATVTVTVTPNEAPVPVASDQTVDEETLVTLDGSSSFDPNEPSDFIETYEWTQTGGTAVTLTDADTPTATFTAPDIDPPSEVLQFRLTVTDTFGVSASHDVSVTVNDVPPGPVSIGSFKSSWPIVFIGDTITLGWSTNDAASCELRDESGVIVSGDCETTPEACNQSDPPGLAQQIDESTTFTLTCQGEEGSEESDTETVWTLPRYQFIFDIPLRLPKVFAKPLL